MGSLGLRCALSLGARGREKAAGQGCTEGSGKLIMDTSPPADLQRIRPLYVKELLYVYVCGGGVGLASLATSV